MALCLANTSTILEKVNVITNLNLNTPKSFHNEYFSTSKVQGVQLDKEEERSAIGFLSASSVIEK